MTTTGDMSQQINVMTQKPHMTSTRKVKIGRRQQDNNNNNR